MRMYTEHKRIAEYEQADSTTENLKPKGIIGFNSTQKQDCFFF